ncbi:TetR/AcrR family transcriptional regulator [Agromyces albus]|nr:TetR/AcrR family transcriptional regulator [Agromyces albus]
MEARERWIEAGIEALRADGIDGVRIDRIARHLGLTKGSFHHHFSGAGQYRLALLERFESDATEALRRVDADLVEATALEALTRLPEVLDSLFDVPLERAVRAWAFADADALAALERVDAARLAAIEARWVAILGPGERARIAALVPHLLVIGASVAAPPISATELRAVFDLLASIAPAVE